MDSATSRMAILGSVRKQAGHAMKSKSVSSTLPWTLCPLLPPGSCSDFLQCGSMSQINPFLLNLPIMVFTHSNSTPKTVLLSTSISLVTPQTLKHFSSPVQIKRLSACVCQDLKPIAWDFPAVLVTFGQMCSCHCCGCFPWHCSAISSSLFSLLLLSLVSHNSNIPLDITSVALEEISRS